MLSHRFKLPLIVTALSGLFALSYLCPASADVSGAHPYYVHGLQDLRAAHRLLDQRSYPNVQGEEVAADRDINRAYHYAVRAAEADQKDLNTYEPVDADLRHHHRLVKALSALEAAHRDFSQYESLQPARGWQHDTVRCVDWAIEHVKKALRDQHWDHEFTSENH